MIVHFQKILKLLKNWGFKTSSLNSLLISIEEIEKNHRTIEEKRSKRSSKYHTLDYAPIKRATGIESKIKEAAQLLFENISSNFFFLSNKFIVSNNTCFSSKENGESIERVFIV